MVAQETGSTSSSRRWPAVGLAWLGALWLAACTYTENRVVAIEGPPDEAAKTADSVVAMLYSEGVGRQFNARFPAIRTGRARLSARVGWLQRWGDQRRTFVQCSLRSRRRIPTAERILDACEETIKASLLAGTHSSPGQLSPAIE